MKRFLVILAIALIAGMAAIVALISRASRDSPEPDVSDLAVERPAIPPEDNAYTYVEYKIIANTIDDLAAGKFSVNDLTSSHGVAPASTPIGRRIPGYFFQPNKTKLTFANLSRDMINNATLYYTDMNLYNVEDVLGPSGSTVQQLIQPNAAGRILYALLIPAYDALLERKCRAECGVAATRLLVGIHAYRKDAGSLPKTLGDLVPAYIDAIPADPFDGQEFRYDPLKSIIYSVGKDGKDSGGSTVLLRGDESDSVQSKRWNSEDAVYEIRRHAHGRPPRT